MSMVDLRSDTLTQPTRAMREAAFKAPVGDDGRTNADGRGEDPTVNRLEDMAAEIIGKEAGLFFPTGTLANVASVLTHCRRGDSVACDPDLHIVMMEKSPFMDRFGGLKKVDYRRDSAEMPETASFAAACAAPGVRLACIENTHNFAGGTCTSLDRAEELHSAAKAKGIPVHLDGARIFNAALSLGVTAEALAACADTVQFCISKGLGAPVGSLLCGPKEFIREARDTRKLLGGVMRQAGMIAAPGLVALEQGIRRLSEDHENARLLGQGLSGFPGIALVPVQTNIVMLNVKGTKKTAPWYERELVSYGILCKAMGDEHLRFTTYRGVTAGDIETAVSAFGKFMQEKEAELI